MRDEELSENGREIYQRYQETHYQRGYTLEEMKALLEAAGMQVRRRTTAFTKNQPLEKVREFM